MSDTLLDYLARQSDPETSHAAAASLDLQPMQVIVLDAIRAAGEHGATAAEVVDATNGRFQQSSVARRITTLKRAGLVRDAGKRPGPWGPDLTVWSVVAEALSVDG